MVVLRICGGFMVSVRILTGAVLEDILKVAFTMISLWRAEPKVGPFVGSAHEVA